MNNPIFISIGSVDIYWYSLLMFVALVVGGFLVLKEAKYLGISENVIVNLFLILIPVSLIGSRLYYVIFNWSIYSHDLLSIFRVWEGGLAIHGGIIGGLITVLLYAKRHKISALLLTDLLVVGLIIGQAIGRWGNFFNSEAHGPATTQAALSKFLPPFIVEGMKIGAYYYHPMFFYECVWCVIGFIILLYLKRIKEIRLGQLTGFYLIWYGLGRFIIEIFRTDSLLIGTMKVAQLVSLIMIFIGVTVVVFFKKGKYIT